MTDKTNLAGEQRKEVRLLDYLYVILKWRKTIFWIMGIGMVATIIVVFLILPRWYKSTAIVMPPKQKAQFSIASVIRSLSPFGGLGVGGASNELDNFLAILNSRSCMEEIVNRFDLVNRYKVKNVAEAIKQLEDNVEFKLGTEDVTLEITAYDRDSLIAAKMANSFVEFLNRIYLHLTTQEARSNREFLEKRYLQNLSDLKTAEENLRDFQKRFGVIALPEQIKASVQAAAEIKSRIALKEIEIGILAKTMNDNSPELLRAKLELSELKKKVAELTVGTDTLVSAVDILPAFRTAPELGLKYVRFYREVELQQKLLEIILPLYEQAKIEEHRDTPTILVLDDAVPSPKPYKPKRLLLTAILLVIIFILSIFLVFVLDFFERLRQEIAMKEDEKLNYIKSNVSWKKFLFVEELTERITKRSK